MNYCIYLPSTLFTFTLHLYTLPVSKNESYPQYKSLQIRQLLNTKYQTFVCSIGFFQPCLSGIRHDFQSMLKIKLLLLQSLCPNFLHLPSTFTHVHMCTYVRAYVHCIHKTVYFHCLIDQIVNLLVIALASITFGTHYTV